MESTPCPTALQRILLKAESCNLYPSELSYQPVKCSFIRSADVTDITGDRLRWPCSTFFFLLSSMLSSAHLLMRRHAKFLSYEKSVKPTNNKLPQMPQVQRFGEVTENFSGKNKRFRDKSTKGFQLPTRAGWMRSLWFSKSLTWCCCCCWLCRSNPARWCRRLILSWTDLLCTLCCRFFRY